jgi:predicted permease
VAFLFVVVMGARGTEIQVTLFEAAMAPMITGSIIAAEYDLDGDLAALMVGVGIPLSFLTLPIWFQLLSVI